MIYFNTSHLETFNHILHYFLEVEFTINKDNDEDIGDLAEMIMPKYLFREQYLKCVKTLENLYDWTADKFYHSMSAFHEFTLYQFINYLSEYQEDIGNDDFKKLYFDEQSHLLIKQASQKEYKEDSDFSEAEYQETFYDLSSYPDYLFEELDFLLIDTLQSQRQLGSTQIESYLGINIDFYFELLPLDIQQKYKSSHITLTGEVSEMLIYVTDSVQYGNLYKLFWENDTPVKEDRIQLILENIMDAYFHKQEVEITREALLGNGKVDFKLYKNNHEDEKVLIEVKRGNSSYLKKGYEKQLTDYMLSSKYKNAFYLVACFTDNEYKRIEKFICEHIYTDTIQLYINIAILDLRKRKPASKS